MNTLIALDAMLVVVAAITCSRMVHAQDPAHCKLSPRNTLCQFKEGSGPAKERRGVDATAIDDVLNGHNKLRAKVANGQQPRQPAASDMQELVWNNGLAAVAQRWADQCKFGHDESRVTPEFPNGVGQNIAQTSGGSSANNSPQFSRAIDMWFDEVKDFNPNSVSSFTFAANTGHYTQVVWAKTYAIGCGYALCGRNTKYYVCNYGPAGNFGRQAVYSTGAACSKCANGCSAKYPGLCVTKSASP